MPNWCENDLYIYGKESDIKKFVKFFGGKNLPKFNFDTIEPYPKKFLDMDKKARKREKLREIEKEKIDNMKIPKKEKEKLREEIDKKYPYLKDGFNSGGYEWCCDKWGVKWNIHKEDVDFYITKESIEIHFSTAWSYPKEAMIKLSKLFPKLTIDIRFFEGGCCFNGLLVVKNGEVIEEDISNYYGHRGG